MANPRRVSYTKHHEWVRDSFLQELDERNIPGVFAMAMPESDLAIPDRVCGMRIWLRNGKSIVCLFTDEDTYEEEF